MTPNDVYNQAFIEVFDIDATQLPGLSYQQIKAWDSVGHMQLVALLEEKFDIMMDTEDIIDLSSYEKGMDILKKYDVNLS